MVLELNIGNEWGVDHLVDGLGLAPGLELALLLVWESIHARTAAIRIIRYKVPTTNDRSLLIVAGLSEEAVGGNRDARALRGGRAAPFPVDFAEGVAGRDAEGRSEAIIVGFNSVGDNDLAGAAGASGVEEEVEDRFGNVFLAELFNDGIDGHGEFAIEDVREVFAVDVDVVFAEAGVDAVNDVFVVFVNEHCASAEDDEIVVESGDGIVEVGLGEDEIQYPLHFSKPKTYRRCFS